jgi:L-amino acid N-acyltransferase YncA
MVRAKTKETTAKAKKVRGSSISLRRLSADDREALLRFAENLPEDDLMYLRNNLKEPEIVDRIISTVEEGRRVVILAEEKDEILGYAGINRRDADWFRHTGEIRIIVDSSRRSKGLGAALTREAVAVARDLGLTKLVAQMAREQQSARRMFEHHGFTIEALLTDWVIDRRDRTHDMILMSLDVTSLTN